MKLYTYWRSNATYRVRVALNLKGLGEVETEALDLLKGHQFAAGYLAVNPQPVVPSLVLDDGEPPLFQSMAILEYLDETHPAPPLLPADARGRARVRGLAQIVVSDSHPLQVPRVRKFLMQEYKLDDAGVAAWIRNWQVEALRALEGHLARDPQTGTYCHGDAVTMADICLAQQVVSSQMAKLDLSPYPTVRRIADACLAQDAFARAHPLRQPDAPAAA